MKQKFFLLLIGLFSVSNIVIAQVQKTSTSNCAPPSASILLEVNNVRARLLNAGDLWWNALTNSSASYEIPKGSNNHSIFSGGLWLSAVDNGGNLHTAAQTYRQNGFDFWPGVLDNIGEVDSVTCKTWDRLFSVKGSDIVQARDGGIVVESITKWPGGYAPYMDINMDGIYEPNNGDYPIYDANVPSNIPAEMVWWVMNDVGGNHTAYTGGLPMGIEIQVTAFAYQSNQSEIINNSTMYRYKIINKSSAPLYDFSFGMFVDSDLGDGNDDYVGCNFSQTGKQVFYTYNADGVDSKYSNKPPAVGLTFLKTLKDENGNQVPPSSYMFFNNSGLPGINADPRNALELHRYLNARWADGLPLIFGTSNGRGTGDSTNFAFTGNVYNPNTWIETAPPSDRRTVVGNGKVSMLPGAINEVVFAMVWAQSDTGANKGSVAKLLASTDTIQQAAQNNFLAFSTGIENNKELMFSIYPNPISDNFSINIPYKNNQIVSTKIYNLQGKLVLEQKFDPASKINVDVNNISKGVYLVNVSQGNKTNTQKIVIQ